MKRTLVIGDIHGGLKALIQVLENAKVTAEDKLIFLGDYVDGWSESAQTIDYLIELDEKQECIFIKGNHDEWCESWLRTGDVDTKWLGSGGVSTIASYKDYNEELRLKHLNFFERCRMFSIDEQNRLFIHAGFTSMHGPQQEFHSSNYGWDRTLWEVARTMDRRIKKDSSLYPRRLKLFEKIYIGHTPTLYYNITEPMLAVNVWNLDTGAAFTGKLSVMDVDSNQYWQSECVKKLYPGEQGRNSN